MASRNTSRQRSTLGRAVSPVKLSSCNKKPSPKAIKQTWAYNSNHSSDTLVHGDTDFSDADMCISQPNSSELVGSSTTDRRRCEYSLKSCSCCKGHSTSQLSCNWRDVVRTNSFDSGFESYGSSSQTLLSSIESLKLKDDDDGLEDSDEALILQPSPRKSSTSILNALQRQTDHSAIYSATPPWTDDGRAGSALPTQRAQIELLVQLRALRLGQACKTWPLVPIVELSPGSGGHNGHTYCSQTNNYSGSGSGGNNSNATGGQGLSGRQSGNNSGFDPTHDPGDDPPRTPSPSNNCVNRFPCVFHKWGRGPGQDPTPHCHKYHKHIANLRIHHSAAGHPDGRFIYCTKCYSKDFETLQDVDEHQRYCVTFVCIDEYCQNYDLAEFDRPTPCLHAPPLPLLKWRRLYRLAHDLGPEAIIPNLDAGTPSPSAPMSRNHSQQTRSPLSRHPEMPTQERIQRGLAPPTGIERAHHSPRHALGFPPYVSFGYAGDSSIQPTTSPSTDSLLPSNPLVHLVSNLNNVASQLERLARQLLPRMVQGHNLLDNFLINWYNASMDDNTMQVDPEVLPDPQIGTTVRRILLLKALIIEYRRLIETPASRNLWSWLAVRSLTSDVLVVSLPEEPHQGWLYDQFQSEIAPNALAPPQMQPNIPHMPILVQTPGNAGSTYNNFLAPAASSDLTVNNAVNLTATLQQVQSQMEQNADPSYDQMRSGFGNHNVNIFLRDSLARGRQNHHFAESLESATTTDRGSGSFLDSGFDGDKLWDDGENPTVFDEPSSM